MIALLMINSSVVNDKAHVDLPFNLPYSTRNRKFDWLKQLKGKSLLKGNTNGKTETHDQEYLWDIPHSSANNYKIMSTCISQFQNLILYFPHCALCGLPAKHSPNP